MPWPLSRTAPGPAVPTETAPFMRRIRRGEEGTKATAALSSTAEEAAPSSTLTPLPARIRAFCWQDVSAPPTTRALPNCGSLDRPEGGSDRHRIFRDGRVDDQRLFIYRALEARSKAGQGPRYGT